MSRIALLGAGADVGRVIALSIAQSGLLQSGAELFLIGRWGGKSAFVVRGLEEDLSEAFQDQGLTFQSSCDLSDAYGDAVIIVASSPDPAHFRKIFHRERLAKENAQIFRSLARSLAFQQSRIGSVIVVTNPNELGVWLFSQTFPQCPVVGIGSLVDSYRFRLEIARQLRVPPSAVQAWVGGEHGPLPVFFWSLVRLFGQPLSDTERESLGCPDMQTFSRLRSQALETVSRILAEEGLDPAYRALFSYPADVRSAVKSYLTHTSGAKTGAVAGQAVTALLRALRCDTEQILPVQVSSTFGSVGVPARISAKGVYPSPELLTEEERRLLKEVGERVGEKIRELMATVAVGS